MKLKKLIEHAFAIATGLIIPGGAIWSYQQILQNETRMECKQEKYKQERALEEMTREVKQKHPKFALRNSELGEIKGNQNFLFPDRMHMIMSIGEAEPKKSEDGIRIGSTLFYEHEKSTAVVGGYLYHENQENKKFAIGIVGIQSHLEDIAVTAENTRSCALIKKIGEQKASIDVEVPPSKTGVEEIAIRLLDNTKGDTFRDDILGICRAPIVYGNPSRKIYLSDFTPEQISLTELDGKKIEIPLTIEVKIPELGITHVYYVKTDGKTAEIPLNWYLHDLKTSTRLSAQIAIKDQSNKGEVIARFNREIDTIPGKKVQIIDPYDSDKNSAYERWKRRHVKTEKIQRTHWLYVFSNFEAGTRFTQELWGKDYELEIKSINGEQKTAIISGEPHMYRAGNNKDIEISTEARRLKLERTFNDELALPVAQVKEIKGKNADNQASFKSVNVMDFYIFDDYEVPKEKK